MCPFKGTNKDPLAQVISLKIEPPGFVQFVFFLGFYCVGNPLETEVVDLTVFKARPSLHVSFVQGPLLLC